MKDSESLEKNCDLHSHTIHSDGVLTPGELIELAKEKKLRAIGVTDHDTISGVPEAIKMGNKLKIEVVPGIELSSEDRGKDVHILGYYIDISSKRLLDWLTTFRDARVMRAKKIVAKLKTYDIDLPVEEVLSLAGSGAVGRPHIAELMVKRGFVKDINEAFDRFIGTNGPAYVPKYKISPGKAIELIKSSGGVPVIAHPGTIGDPDYVVYLAKLGIQGIEVWHPEHPQELIEIFNKMADDLGLLKTGGSDFHGGKRGKADLGTIRVPYTLVEKLKWQRDRNRNS